MKSKDDARYSFYAKQQARVRINMTCSSLYGKIFDNLTNEEFSQNLWDFDASEDKTVTDKTFIKKVWDASIMYGYIPVIMIFWVILLIW